jgi:hypothetical protein
MATLAAPTTDRSHVMEILELARTVLRRHCDHDLAQRIMVLQGYLELSRVNPNRGYHDLIIQKAFGKLLTALVDFDLNERSGAVFKQAAS